MSAPRPLIEVRNLSIGLAGRQITRDVSFDIPAGGALALVGESGSGKTITSRALTGLLGRIGGRIASGTVEFDGRDMTNAGERDWQALRGKDIALVPQASLSSLDPIMRIGRQLAETIARHDPVADRRARSIELLEQVKLPRAAALLDAYPHELSGGMRQRVMIALALAGRPRFVVADEPTTALDVTVQREVLTLLGELRRETGMALLMIAHDLAVVRMISENVAVMRAGEIVEIGATETVLSRPAHAYTRALLAARPELAGPGEPLAVLDVATGELSRPALPEARTAQISDAVIEARAVSMTFRGATAPAVAPVDLSIRRGASIGIVGESGSGKSTLGRMLVGALVPTNGQVLVHGRPWSAVRNSEALRGKVQMIFQDPYGALTPWRTPRAIVAEVAAKWQDLSRRAALERAGDILNEVGLPLQAMDRLPGRLSGGQCQRVGIARALACEPEVLIADEPTSSLDVSSQAQVLNLLLGLRATRGLALVMISHDLAVIRHMTDEALVMSRGEVVERAGSQQMLAAPQHEYTRRLVTSTPVLHPAAAPA